MSTKSSVITIVEEGQQAIVIVLLAKNENGTPILDSQKQAAEALAKNALQLAGAEVAAQSSAIMFDATAPGEVAKLTATLETVEVRAVEEPVEEPVEAPVEDEPIKTEEEPTEEPTETDVENESEL